MEIKPEDLYLSVNRETWDAKVDTHYNSPFYNTEAFLTGKNSLNAIELALLGDVNNLSILHLQCHFGQDTISLSRLGATATGVDFSEKALNKAKSLAEVCHTNTRFILSDIYDLPNIHKESYDVVFSSYGTIGWMPDINKWAAVVANFIKPGGKFVFAEFHPFIWMYDNDFDKVAYSYFKAEAIVETEEGTYADRNVSQQFTSITWNHSISSVIQALTDQGLQLSILNEYDYSPYACFNHSIEVSPGKYHIRNFGNKIPYVYGLVVEKS